MHTTTVYISQSYFYNPDTFPRLTIAEVKFTFQGVQIAHGVLNFQCTSYDSNDYDSTSYPHFPELANDGNIYTYFHSYEPDPTGIPTLTITMDASVIFDTIVVINRLNCCQFRINGATITVRSNQTQVYSAVFASTSASQYTFNVMSPCSAGISQRKLSPLT